MTNRLPRKTKKAIKGRILIYDIQSMPKFANLERLLYEFKNHQLVLWDSLLGGQKPQIIGNKKKLKFIDSPLTNL